MISGYDIIGDIHGQAGMLKALLPKLGYRLNSDGSFSHPDRQAIFVGDYTDRHPRQAEVLEVVRPMIDQGHALGIMGNHEHNAICFSTPRADGVDYVRRHGGRNVEQHQAFLDEFPFGSPEHADQIAWFKKLPVFLDLKDIFIVHACCSPEDIEIIRPYLNPDNTLTDQSYVDFGDQQSDLFKSVEILMKGPEHNLPPEVAYVDPMGVRREKVRTQWWLDDTLPTSQRLETRAQRDLSDTEKKLVDKSVITRNFNNPSKHSFIGHYWLTGTPAPLSEQLACVDYSAAKDGDLVAYRWGGESKLSARNFVW